MFVDNTSVLKPDTEDHLNQIELEDYLAHGGQWNQNNIHDSGYKKLELKEIIGVVDDKKKKGKKDEVIVADENSQNLVVPQSPVSNPELGDLMNFLFEIEFGCDENEENINMFENIPIKIALVGKSSCGKKLQAKYLSENYPLKTYKIERLVQEALDILDRLEKPIEEISENSLKNAQIKKIMEDRLKADAKYKEVRETAVKIRTLLRNGKAISDDLYVDLIVNFLKIDFPQTDRKRHYEKIVEKEKRKEEIMEEIEKIKEDNPDDYHILEEYDLRNKELVKISLESTKGFVICDFPNTFNQAKELEKRLTGYVAPNEKEKSKTDLIKFKSSALLDRSPEIKPPKRLIKGGLDFIFFLDVPNNECIRRTVGLRVNRETSEVFHLEDKEPQATANFNCENLVPCDDFMNNLSTLVVRNLSFEKNSPMLEHFYEPFGFEDQQLLMFNKIDSNKGEDYVTQELITVIDRLIKINEEKEMKICEEFMEIDREELEIGNKINNDEEVSIDARDSQVLSEKPKDDYTLYREKFLKVKEVIDKDYTSLLIRIWNEIYENYVREAQSVFSFLRKQRNLIAKTFEMMQKEFIEYVKRPSTKQIHLMEFQHTYNKFIDEYPDLTDDDKVKEQHHQEVDDLYDKIYEIIETNKRENIEERKRIMTIGFVENEEEKLYLEVEKLYQTEIDKFLGCLQLIRDYYFALDRREFLEIHQENFDVITEEVLI